MGSADKKDERESIFFFFTISTLKTFLFFAVKSRLFILSPYFFLSIRNKLITKRKLGPARKPQERRAVRAYHKLFFPLLNQTTCFVYQGPMYDVKCSFSYTVKPLSLTLSNILNNTSKECLIDKECRRCCCAHRVDTKLSTYEPGLRD